MLGKFWEGLGSGLADRFLTRLLTPALLFWALGAAAWLSSGTGPGAAARPWAPLRAAVAGLESLPGTLQLAALVVALFALIASAVVAERLTLPLLRVLEGYYWPSWLAVRLRARARAKRDQMLARATELLRLQTASALSSERAVELATLEEGLRRRPWAPQLLMPTRLGNILRAAEERPGSHYGLDATVCWPALWLLLDKDIRAEVASARATLNGSVTLWLWAVASLAWTALAWWVLPVAVAVALAVYYVAILSSAQVYGDLLNSVFDLRRWLLYEALRWPLPETPSAEPDSGRALTTYLWRGQAPTGSAFRSAPTPPGSP